MGAILGGDVKITVSSHNVDVSSPVTVKQAGGGLVSSTCDDAGWQTPLPQGMGQKRAGVGGVARELVFS